MVGKVCALVVLTAALIAPSEGNAQSITDARRAEFTPSTDHNAVDASTGVALLQRYSLDVFLVGGATPVSTADLGKPTPDADGMIRIDFVSRLTTALTPSVIYEAVVSAVGPGGTAPGARSNTFSFSLACAPSISPASQAVAAAGGTGSSTVTVAAGCLWTAASNATWITVTSGASGSGSGPVTFSVAANTGTTSRTGTLTIAGSTFTVTQAAPACVPTISPASANVVAAATTGSVMVTAPATCAWTATSNATWLTISAGASDTGDGAVIYSVSANPTTSVRTGTLTIAGSTFTVTQAAGACSYTISPTSQTVSATGGNGTVTVTTTSGCGWSATSGASWVTISGGTGRTGSGSVTFTAASNTTTAARTATLTIAGRSFAVNQSAAACTFSVNPLSVTLPSGGGTGTIAVTTQSGCAWTSSTANSWITLTGSATGSGSATYSVPANAGTSSRSGTITVAGIQIGVTQEAIRTPAPPTNLRIVR
jgi:hypothetical protein